jgi:hypothetical protein
MGLMTKDTRIHELYHDEHGLWMTDRPEELNQIGELVHSVNLHGGVLIGGLGLGVLARVVTDHSLVTDVTVIELDPDVIKLCSGSGYRVIQADVAKYLKESSEHYDFYLLDTWQSTSEGTWWNDVMPMRRTIRNRWGGKPVIHCWAEDIMVGQLTRALMGRPHWYYENLAPMTLRDVRRFTRDVGLPTWEKRWGAIVDANFKRIKQEEDDVEELVK